jgi:type II secretion system protein G
MTLIEILVVLVLLSVIMTVVAGNYIGRGEKAKADAAKIDMGQISQTLDLYKLEIGRYPTTQEGLQALVSAPAGVANWDGPYWKKRSVRTVGPANPFVRRRRRATKSSRSAPTAGRRGRGTSGARWRSPHLNDRQLPVALSRFAGGAARAIVSR